MGFINNLKADFIKIKGLSIGLAHLLIPILVCIVFWSYYSYSGWEASTKVTAFYQAIGAGFPILIGIFSASIAEQELSAGGCQNLLTSRRKTTAFLSKLALLLLIGLGALLFTSVLFAFGYREILGNAVFPIRVYVIIVMVMWCSSIPLYIWHIFFAFQLGKGATIGLGIAEGLVNALILTDLGEYIWEYVPCSWTGRIPDTYLLLLLGHLEKQQQLGDVLSIYFIVTIVSFVCLILWAMHWEGNKVAE